MLDIPLMHALKEYGAQFNENEMLRLPTNTPYGNLTLTYSEIITRIDCLNELITALYSEFYALHELIKQRGGWAHMNESFKHKFQIEQVIYWLRKTADELLCMISILSHHKSTEEFPDQVKVSSIGKYLKNKNMLDIDLSKHDRLLNILNDVSNGFKHSIINAQVNAHQGIYEPLVFALIGFNNIHKPPTMHQHSLREILVAYDAFLKDAKGILTKFISY